MKHVLVFIFISACCSLETSAQSADSISEKFRILTERVKKLDTTVSFTEWRYTYAKTTEYFPYESGSREAIQKAHKLVDEKKHAEAMAVLEKALEKYYVSIDLHFTLATIQLHLDSNSKDGSFHRWVVAKILYSIDSSGDGASPETAMHVISTSEEYVWLRFEKIKSTSQALINKDGHVFDQMSGESRDGTKHSFYFNVDRLFASMRMHFDK